MIYKKAAKMIKKLKAQVDHLALRAFRFDKFGEHKKLAETLKLQRQIERELIKLVSANA